MLNVFYFCLNIVKAVENILYGKEHYSASMEHIKEEINKMNTFKVLIYNAIQSFKIMLCNDKYWCKTALWISNSLHPSNSISKATVCVAPGHLPTIP